METDGPAQHAVLTCTYSGPGAGHQHSGRYITQERRLYARAGSPAKAYSTKRGLDESTLGAAYPLRTARRCGLRQRKHLGTHASAERTLGGRPGFGIDSNTAVDLAANRSNDTKYDHID